MDESSLGETPPIYLLKGRPNLGITTPPKSSVSDEYSEKVIE